jgi:hypothetical protein
VIFELKPLTREAIPKALEKAERYRLLNEPAQAESICLDVLQIDPGNQQALVMLLLALTDQFEQGMAGTVTQAREVLTRLTDEYARLYYAGIIAERRAGARLQHEAPAWRPRIRVRGVRMVAGGDDLVREGRGHPSSGQRRRAAALEHVCPHPDAQPAPPARSGGPLGATPGVDADETGDSTR